MDINGQKKNVNTQLCFPIIIIKKNAQFQYLLPQRMITTTRNKRKNPILDIFSYYLILISPLWFTRVIYTYIYISTHTHTLSVFGWLTVLFILNNTVLSPPPSTKKRSSRKFPLGGPGEFKQQRERRKETKKSIMFRGILKRANLLFLK